MSLPGTHACNRKIQEAEAGRLQIQGQPGLHNKSLFQNALPSTHKPVPFVPLLLGTEEGSMWSQWSNGRQDLEGFLVRTLALEPGVAA